MHYSQPVITLIQQRFSCRSYLNTPIADDTQRRLQDALASLRAGPLGTPLRFQLIAAAPGDEDALKGLGTYGFIKGATGFIVGAAGRAPMDLEDYGYALEQAVLAATDLGLGTCWLGGSFTRSSFARKIAAKRDEQTPAVVATGYIADEVRSRQGMLRRQVGADSRLPWESLFFSKRLGAPLSREEAGAYALPLDMVRLGPSASNKQPWRIVQDGDRWHFFLQRTPGYGGGIFSKLMKMADIQRLDIGIAMCHFELTAGQLGLSGAWVVEKPAIEPADNLTEYRVSWASA